MERHKSHQDFDVNLRIRGRAGKLGRIAVQLVLHSASAIYDGTPPHYPSYPYYSCESELSRTDVLAVFLSIELECRPGYSQG